MNDDRGRGGDGYKGQTFADKGPAQGKLVGEQHGLAQFRFASKFGRSREDQTAGQPMSDLAPSPPLMTVIGMASAQEQIDDTDLRE